MAKLVYTFHGFLSPISTTYTIREPSNLFTTFVLMLIVIILSFVEWQHGWGVFCMCEDELFTCTANVHFSWLFVSHFYIHHLWTFKLVHHLWFDANSHNFEFRWATTWLRCVLYTCEDELFTCTAKLVYTFHGFLSPISTYTIREPSNLFTTFVLMLIVIILSFVEWQHGWGVFCMCEDELFTCTANVHFSWLFVSHFYIHHLWTFKLVDHFYFDANSHNSAFRWVATWLRCVVKDAYGIACHWVLIY